MRAAANTAATGLSVGLELPAAGGTPAATASSPRRPVRVLVLTSTFPRWADDNEPRFVLDLCRHLLPEAEVLVLAPHTVGAALEEHLEGVRVRRFRYLPAGLEGVAYAGGIMARLRTNPARVLQVPFFLAALTVAAQRAIRDFEPDVIHAHWIVPQGVAAAAVAGRVPILCTSHGGDLHGLRGPLLHRLKSWALQRCSSITVVSDSMVADVQRLAPACPVEVIPMGTDLKTTFVPPPENAARDPNHVLFVGRLVEKKGLRYLLEAMAALKPTHPDLRLTVVGDGPLRAALKDRAGALGLGRDVEFLGSLRHAELPALYRRAALAVFPFVVADDGDQEGFGLVVVEAVGCGCPVIASDLPALRQTIEHGVTGILTPPRDVEALANAIREAIADPARGARIAAAALAKAREQFDWSAIGARYLRTIEEVAFT